MKRVIIMFSVMLVLTSCTPNEASNGNELTGSQINEYIKEIDDLKTERNNFKKELSDLNARVLELENQLIEKDSLINTYKDDLLKMENEQNVVDKTPLVVGDNAKVLLKHIDEKVVKALSERNLKALSEYTHPAVGVRFTPYSYVAVESDIVLTKDALESDNIFKSEKLWGHYDGSGFEMLLSFEDYYNEFVYSADFIKPDRITYNEPNSTGNMIDNHYDVYGSCISVDYHFDYFNEEWIGMDWKTLRLVFLRCMKGSTI